MSKPQFRVIKLEYWVDGMYAWKPVYLPPSIKVKGETIDDMLSYLIRMLITNKLMTYAELARVFMRTTSGWPDKEYMMRELIKNGGIVMNNKEETKHAISKA